MSPLLLVASLFATVASPAKQLLCPATNPHKNLEKIIDAIARATILVSKDLQEARCDSYSCFHQFSSHDNPKEPELAVDLASERHFTEMLTNSHSVHLIASILQPETTKLIDEDEPYAVVINPLDGASVLDTNFAPGSLFAVFKAKDFIGRKGTDVIAAGVAIYGPRTTLSLAYSSDPGVKEFLLVDKDECHDGRWVFSNEYNSIEEGKLFAPGNLRAVGENQGYAELVNFWQSNAYQLRYTGGMCLDVMQILIRGHGVFTVPASRGKLPTPHLLFEAIPLAFLMDKCGGSTSDGRTSILDLAVHRLDERTQLALGSKNEVARFERSVGGAGKVRSILERSV